MGFTTPMMLAGLGANRAYAAIGASFGSPRKDSGNDAFGAIADALPGNSFDVR
jgi:hypothetical protein